MGTKLRGKASPMYQHLDHAYFVTTLGQAEVLNSLLQTPLTDDEDSIIKLVDNRAKLYPDAPVVGECLPPSEEGGAWRWRCFSKFTYSILWYEHS